MRSVIAIMAKLPWPGRAKTRLCPPLGAEDAAGLAYAFLRDRIAQVAALGGASGALAFAPESARPFFAGVAPADFTLVCPDGDDLGAHLGSTFDRLFAAGHDAVIAVDSDSPTLPPARLAAALAALGDPATDVVLGPAEDGGYYLIGLRAPRPELFADMPWSTPRVLPETLRRCAAAGLRVTQLDPWWDVDAPADLERLRAALAAPGDDAPHTRGFLAPRADAGRGELAERPWLRLASRPVHRTRFLDHREDLVELPDGRLTTYGVIDCGRCVGVLPFVDRDTVVLCRQWRYVAGRATWEMPTGGVHPGEDVLVAAQRELAEEVGFRAERLVPLGAYHTSKSVMDETAYLFIGEGLSPAEVPPDDTEFIAVRRFPFAEVLRLVESGEITDSMTIIAVLRAARRRP